MPDKDPSNPFLEMNRLSAHYIRTLESLFGGMKRESARYPKLEVARQELQALASKVNAMSDEDPEFLTQLALLDNRIAEFEKMRSNSK